MFLCQSQLQLKQQLDEAQKSLEASRARKMELVALAKVWTEMYGT